MSALLLEAAVTLPDPLHEALEAALAADIDAITRGLSREECVKASTLAAIADLDGRGFFKSPITGEGQLELDARLLAQHSTNPRHKGDGWTYVRAYEGDIVNAHRHGIERLGFGEEELATRLGEAKQRLLDNLQEATS